MSVFIIPLKYKNDITQYEEFDSLTEMCKNFNTSKSGYIKQKYRKYIETLEPTKISIHNKIYYLTENPGDFWDI